MNPFSKNSKIKLPTVLVKFPIVTFPLLAVFFILATGCPSNAPPEPAPVEADFSADKILIAKGETVTFTDKSANNPTNWSWKFEGGTPATSIEKNPKITYNTEGSFNVELSIYAPGSIDTKKASAFITVAPRCGTLTDIDGHSYKLVEINGKCWMAENLRTSKYRDGTAIITGLDSAAWEKATEGAYTIYDNKETNNTLYGKLYNYSALTSPKGLCPIGWHVPTKAEFDAMVTFLGGEDAAGGALRTTTGWTEPNTGATNSSGFSAVPGGAYSTDGGFHGEPSQGYYMALTSKGFYSYLILYGETGYMYSSEFTSNYLAEVGQSCRCTKD